MKISYANNHYSYRSIKWIRKRNCISLGSLSTYYMNRYRYIIIIISELVINTPSFASRTYNNDANGIVYYNIIFINLSLLLFRVLGGIKRYDTPLIVRLLKSSESTPTPPPRHCSIRAIYCNTYVRIYAWCNSLWSFQAQSQFPKRAKGIYYLFYV